MTASRRRDSFGPSRLPQKLVERREDLACLLASRRNSGVRLGELLLLLELHWRALLLVLIDDFEWDEPPHLLLLLVVMVMVVILHLVLVIG